MWPMGLLSFMKNKPSIVDLRSNELFFTFIFFHFRVARDDADDESVNNDPLPFDPKDATEPVEV